MKSSCLSHDTYPFLRLIFFFLGWFFMVDEVQPTPDELFLEVECDMKNNNNKKGF